MAESIETNRRDDPDLVQPVERRADDEIRAELHSKLSVPLWPTAAQAVGSGKEAALAAARRGTFPGAFRVGRKWRVATQPLCRVLKIDEQPAA